jgi:phage shock protein A
MARATGGDEKAAKNFYLRKDVITQLEDLAKAKGIAPSQLIEDWTMATTDGDSDLSPKLLSMLHQRHTELTAAVEALTTHMDTLSKHVAQLHSAHDVLQREIKNLDSGPLTRIIDAVLKVEAWTQKGWLKR